MGNQNTCSECSGENRSCRSFHVKLTGPSITQSVRDHESLFIGKNSLLP
ncbi:MAG: hypothetical protein OJF51_003038 [Nitrospira sp.]|nr:MAG: hypothetical protein OJF51_003038 [Nitrospira sp.]